MATAKTDTRPETLRGIALHGFKCFRDPRRIVIRPLTLLAGANSAGKSTVMQPLLLMKQTLEAPYDPGVLLLEGPLVHVERARSLFWKSKAKKGTASSWSVTIDGPGACVRTTFAEDDQGIKVLQEERLESMDGPVQEVLRADSQPVQVTLPGQKEPGQIRIQRDRFVLRKVLANKDRFTQYLRPSNLDFRLLTSLIHLPGLRGNPARAYLVARPGRAISGPFTPYTAGVLLDWKDSEDDALAGVGDDLRSLGVSWKVDPRRQRGTDTAVEIHLGRLPAPQVGGAKDYVNIADVGFGASQVLPVVVALRAARPGQVVHIEQPELHLHPRAQEAMAGLLVAAALRGAQVIAETHSSVLIRAVQLAVANGEIPPEDVVLHWFERDAEGVTKVTQGNIDRAGAYGDWPIDFTQVELEVDSKLIDAAFK